MQKFYARKIKSNLRRLCLDTIDTIVFIVNLFSNDVLSEEEFERIRHITDPYKAHLEIYTLIMKKEDNAFQLLLDCLAKSGNEELKKILIGHDWKEDSVISEKVWFEVLPHNPYFVGREKDLKNIDDYWKENFDRKTLPLLVITGEEGVGKSDLARKYVHQFHQKVSGHCLWIDAQSGQAIVNSVQNLATELTTMNFDRNVSEYYIINKICNHFKGHECIFVFDGLGDYSEKHFRLFFQNCQTVGPSTAKPFILLTSRNDSVHTAFELHAKQVPIGKFDHDQNCQFFNEVFQPFHDNVDEELMNQLANATKGHPAAMVRVAAYILDTYNRMINPKSLVDAINLTLQHIQIGRLILFATNEYNE